MSAAFLLDTNIISAFLKQPGGPVALTISRKPDDASVTNVIVAGELRFGAARVGNAVFSQRIERALSLFPVLTMNEPVAEIYGKVRARLQSLGKPIGANDLWIAAHALSLDLTLVTDNEEEFRRVEGLRVENWMRD